MSSHEPIILDAEDWSKSHALVQYNLNRLAQNAHDDRNRFHALLLSEEAKRGEALMRVTSLRDDDIKRYTEIRERDLERIGDRYDPIFPRLSAAETRAAIYGAVAGFAASGLLTVVLFVAGKLWK